MKARSNLFGLIVGLTLSACASQNSETKATATGATQETSTTVINGSVPRARTAKFDGDYKKISLSNVSTGPGCRPWDLKVDVAGGVITGAFVGPRAWVKATGVVNEDGTFDATYNDGQGHFSGKIVSGRLTEVKMYSHECTYSVSQ